MTQGYGPDYGQQPQWGQEGQNPPPAAQPQWGQPEQQQPQWGQPEQQQPQWSQPSPSPQPQWGPASPGPYAGAPMGSPAQPGWDQASPTAAPGGYPGAVGASNAFGAPGSGAPSKVAGLIKWMFFAVLAVIAVRLIGNVITFAIGFAGGAADSDAMALGSGVAGLLSLGANGLVSLAALVLAIMVIVQASGRGRTGAIVVVATLVLAVIAYWIVYGIYMLVVMGSTDYGMIGVMSMVYLVAEIIRSLIVFAVLIVGAMMSRRWAKQSA